MRYFNLKEENHTYLIAESRIIGFIIEEDSSAPQPTRVTFLLASGESKEIELKMSIRQIQGIIADSKSPIINLI
jgi:hypothetical protein